VLDGSGTTHLHDVPAWVDPSADDSPLGAISVGVNGVDHRPDDDADYLRRDLVVRALIPIHPGTQP
jgi:hypothetical protein